MNEKITIKATVNASIEKIWEFWTEPQHIKKWNNASEDWHTTFAENDLKAGGKFLSRMEAKDGSFGFDFSGVYDEIILYKKIDYTLDNKRKVKIVFEDKANKTDITMVFEAETENSIELQKNGWQAILDNFKKYTELNNSTSIVPHLWYDKEAKEAALFYIGLFENSKLLDVTVIENTPSGDAETVSFELSGQRFEAISAGPFFKFNPTASFMVACYSVEEVNTKWKALSEGGTELMPLGEYGFNKFYGWIQDKYGLSWQLMLMDEGQNISKITPNLLFSNTSCGRAEEAVHYYVQVFENSEISLVNRYKEGEASSSKAKVNYVSFKLSGMDFTAMDNGYDVDFDFNEAISFIINCNNQEEIDYFWEKLSAVPESEQCGWVKDKFGVSWQIVPVVLSEMLKSGDKEKNIRVTKAFLQMKKLDIETLQKAYDGIK